MPGKTAVLFNLFETLQIEPHKKSVLQQRYLKVLQNFQTRAVRLYYMFYSARIIITVGSILVPAFLSIQGTPYQVQLYWGTWLLSLLVTICNGLVTLFKIDKKYFFINTTLELLHSEGWQYVGLSGRYGPKDGHAPPTHENQFLVFFHMAEKIKMRQVEEEYWKFTDTSGVGNATNQRPTNYVQTPSTLTVLPVKDAEILQEWVGDIKGLAPRTIDGETNPPTLPRTSANPLMSMQSNLQESSTGRSTMVSTSPVQESPKETLVLTVRE